MSGLSSAARAALQALSSHAVIVAAWRKAGGDAEAARRLTLAQVTGLRAILANDEAWQHLLRAFARKELDNWVAGDWPGGFDELLLCAPLCKLVSFECARCIIGSRQGNSSCAHPSSLFGRVGELLRAGDRASLEAHLNFIAAMLAPDSQLRWDTTRLEIV